MREKLSELVTQLNAISTHTWAVDPPRQQGYSWWYRVTCDGFPVKFAEEGEWVLGKVVYGFLYGYLVATAQEKK